MNACSRASGDLCFVACVPSAWGSGGPCAGQLEAQSVEGVHCSVVGGWMGPQRRPDHLPWSPLWPGCTAWQAQPGTDSSAEPNLQDTEEEEEGRRGRKVRHAKEERGDRKGCVGGGNFSERGEGGGTCSQQGSKNSSKVQARCQVWREAG